MQAWVVLLLLAFIPTVRGQPSYGEFEAAAAARADLGLDGAISTAEGNDTFSVQDIRERVSSPWPGISGRNAGFVSTSGPNFILGGNPWYCAGTSAYYAALEWIMSENEVEVMMREHARQGATVLRVFAHNNFWPEPQVMMRFFGQYNETNIRRLDLVLAAAADNGIRLIMTLGNHWKFTGGAQQYVNYGIRPGEPLQLFYADDLLRGYYKDWITHIVTRTNTITGQRYVDDPTILAWELLNEPRLGSFDTTQGLAPGSIICDWVGEMAAHVKALDGNHLVTTGEEGFRTEGNGNVTFAWLNTGGTLGSNFDCNIAHPEIDFATLHPYPDAWGFKAPRGYEWFGPNFLEDRAKVAHALGKPIVLGEYGMRRDYLPSREPLMTFMQDRANENDH